MVEINNLNKYKLVNFKKVLGIDGGDELFIVDGKISTNPPNGNPIFEIDCKDGIVAPGFVDVQVNGIGDCNFWDVETLTFEKIDKLREKLALSGVVAFCPTIITASKDCIFKSIDFVNSYLKQTSDSIGAKILGIHLEGIFVTNYGVHEQRHSQSVLSVENISPFLKENVLLFTYAPELDVNGEVNRYLTSKNVLVSMGHSAGNYSQGVKAIKEQNYNTVTHMFNAMRGVDGFSHRIKDKCNVSVLKAKLSDESKIDPITDGIMLSLLKEKKVLCMVIADGKHVCKEALKFLIERKGKEFMALVSDCVAKDFYDVMHSKGMLAGGQNALDKCVKNLVDWGICSVDEALYMASVTISKRLKTIRDIGLGEIVEGKPANLVVWNAEKNTVLGTMIGGNVFLQQ